MIPDPISLLRCYFQAGRLNEVRKVGENMIFGNISWPRTTKTCIRIYGSETKDGEWDYYTLEYIFMSLLSANCLIKLMSITPSKAILEQVDSSLLKSIQMKGGIRSLQDFLGRPARTVSNVSPVSTAIISPVTVKPSSASNKASFPTETSDTIDPIPDSVPKAEIGSSTASVIGAMPVPSINPVPVNTTTLVAATRESGPAIKPPVSFTPLVSALTPILIEAPTIAPSTKRPYNCIVDEQILHVSKKPRIEDTQHLYSKSAIEFDSDRFKNLPNSIILKILSFLKLPDIVRTSRVSHRFNRLCMDPILWRNVWIPDSMDIKAATQLLDRCSPLLQELFLCPRDYSLYLASYALQRCKRLAVLTINVDRNIEPLLKAIADNGNSLRKLYISGTWDPMELLSRAPCLKRLTFLSMASNDFNDSGLRAIADCCISLEEINIEDANDLSDEAMSYFFTNIRGTIKRINFEADRFSAVTLANIGQCQHLETLVIRGASALEASGLEAISRLPKLAQLAIENAPLLESSSIATIFNGNNFRLLTELFVSTWGGLNGSALGAIADTCPNLIILAIANCEQIRDKDVHYVLFKCRKLELLQLRYLKSITKGVLANIPPQLRKFILPHNIVGDIDYDYLQRFEETNPELRIEFDSFSDTIT